ncbi:MAG TPA: ParB/RepB/Spo0J family partition protein [Phycisphaerae bacterium]|nr:ParB/RepB/Spo0J family partition protein [Phycisphaerae bacterium]
MTTKDRPRLGRGLKAILTTPVTVQHPESKPPLPAETADGDDKGGERLRIVDVALIDPNPHQPRGTMDPVALHELAASIRVSGVLQPVILRPMDGGRYQLVAGHRRTEAAKLAGLQNVPAVVRHDSTDERQAEWALIENIQRQDLNPVERAKAYRRYVDTFHLTHAQAAERLGEDRATVSNFLRLLDLNTGVQDLIARGLLSAGHAKVLAGITDPARQDRLANQAVTEGLSVRRLEEAAAADTPPSGETTTVAGHTRSIAAKSAHVVELEQDLSRKLGTKLRIFPSQKRNTGKIVIQYFSLDEFDRIVERFN